MEEPYPETFFPPIGGGNTAFSPYMSLDSAIAKRAELDAFESQQDKMATDRAANEYSRLEYMDRRRILPYSTAARIAAEKASKTRSEASERMSPFLEDRTVAESQLQTEKALTDLDQLPEQAQYETIDRRAEMESIQNADPHLSKLQQISKSPEHILAYESYLRRPEIRGTRADRQRQAFNKTLRLVQDRPIVEAIEELDDDGTLRDKFISDDELDPETGISLGPKIKDDANRSELAKLLAKHRTQKARLAQDREERLAAKDENALWLRAFSEEKDSAKAMLRDALTDAERAEARQKMEEADNKIKLLWEQRESKGLPQKQPASPGNAQAAPVQQVKKTPKEIRESLYKQAKAVSEEGE